jgi:hypothetical protein
VVVFVTPSPIAADAVRYVYGMRDESITGFSSFPNPLQHLPGEFLVGV